MMNDIVFLKHSDGSKSDPIPRERAAFIVAFTMSGPRPEILESYKCDICGPVPVDGNVVIHRDVIHPRDWKSKDLVHLTPPLSG